MADDIRPVRNLKADRERVRRALDQNTPDLSKINAGRRNNLEFKVGDIVLMHRDSTMHKSKLNYEMLGPYEIVSITKHGRYEIKRLGKNLITKAAKEQLRLWPVEWSVGYDAEELLELFEIENIDN